MSISYYQQCLLDAQSDERTAHAAAERANLVAAESSAWRFYVESWEATAHAEDQLKLWPQSQSMAEAAEHAHRESQRRSNAWHHLYQSLYDE